MQFIGIQLARTTAAQTSTMESARLMAKVAFDGTPPDGYSLSPAEAIRLTLSTGPLMADSLQDLAVTLISPCPGATFATSDNPAFRYNSYCEGTGDFGVTGAQCRGLQVFLPISPTLLLYLFDAGVYKLARANPAHFVAATAEDMEQLNRLQLVSAHENVYFTTPALGRCLLDSASWTHSIRRDIRPKITTAVAEDDELSELLHQYTPMPQLNLRLSFSPVRAHAEKKPLITRVRQMRGPYKARPRGPRRPGTSQRFVVKAHYSA